MKVIALGGEPATGKTTLTKRLFRNIPDFQVTKYGLLRLLVSEQDRLLLLGIYNFKANTPFEGTDRLSMSVILDARRFIKWASQNRKDYNIFFEGDRLFTQDFIDHCRSICETKVYVLTCEPEALEKRHVERGDLQNGSWLKGRTTKIANIANEPRNKALLLPNKDKDDLIRNLHILRTELNL